MKISAVNIFIKLLDYAKESATGDSKLLQKKKFKKPQKEQGFDW